MLKGKDHRLHKCAFVGGLGGGRGPGPRGREGGWALRRRRWVVGEERRVLGGLGDALLGGLGLGGQIPFFLFLVVFLALSLRLGLVGGWGRRGVGVESRDGSEEGLWKMWIGERGVRLLKVGERLNARDVVSSRP